MSDLSLATVEELTAELQRRFTITLFVGSRPQHTGTDKCYTVIFSGDYMTALGAARYADIYFMTFVSNGIVDATIAAQQNAAEEDDEEDE